MEEVIYSFGCLSALLVLPVLLISVLRVRSANKSLAERIRRLEDKVAEIAPQTLSHSQQVAASAGQTDAPNSAATTRGESSAGAEKDVQIDAPLYGEPEANESPYPKRDVGQQQADIEDVEPNTQPSGILKGISPREPEPLLAQSTLQDVIATRPHSASGRNFSGIRKLFGWFTKMHLMVQLGLLILFIGVAFLIKFVADQGLLSIELRLLISAILGFGLTAVGWRLRNRARTYGMALMGGGLAIDYLTTYGAMLYTAFPATLAFAVFIVLGVIGALLAIFANAQILAFLAIVGAFLAPILASTGGGSHIVLFSYYAVVNLGILAIAWFKAWRRLNVAGYIFTMIVGLFWGLESYTPDLFASTEFFLILFYLIYVVIAVLFAARKAIQLSVERGRTFNRQDVVDVTLIYGNPLAAFSIQAYLMQDVAYGLAMSTFAAGVMYGVLGIVFVTRWRRFRPVAESFLFLAGLFIALTVPLTFGAQATSAIWTIMGLAWVWSGSVRNRWWQKGWGVLIQGAAALSLVNSTDLFTLFDNAAFINEFYLGAVLISLSAYASGYLLGHGQSNKPFNLHDEAQSDLDSNVQLANTENLKPDEEITLVHQEPEAVHQSEERTLWPNLFSGVLTLWAHFWWFGGGTLQILDFVNEHESTTYLFAAMLAFISLSAGISEWIGARLRWSTIRLPSFLLMPLLLCGAVLQTDFAEWPFAAGGWYAWPIGLGIAYWALYRWDRFGDVPWFNQANPPETRYRTRFHHLIGLWTVVWMLVRIAIFTVELWTDAPGWIGFASIGIATLAAWIIVGTGERWSWPVGGRLQLYQIWGAGPLLGAALLMIMAVNATNGDASPIPYLPLLNPLDLVQFAFFFVAFSWVGRHLDASKRIGYWVVGVSAFLALNAGLARGVHHLIGEPFDVSPFTTSSILQTIYAVSWGMLATVLMFLAHIKGQGWRNVWIGGAIVLALTVLKLFAIDLANSGTIARIISFIATGLLIIVIAYFAPAPPSSESEEETVYDEAVYVDD